MRDVELADQPVERAGLLERVQVLALDVLDERHRDRGFVGHDADDGRDVVQAGHLRGPPATLARDDLVADRLAGLLGGERAHHDRLHDALGADRVGEFLQAFGTHVEARLVAAALQQVDRDAREFLVARRGRDRRRGLGADVPCASTAAAGVGACAGVTEPSRASRPRPREGRFVAIADYYAARVARAQETPLNRVRAGGLHASRCRPAAGWTDQLLRQRWHGLGAAAGTARPLNRRRIPCVGKMRRCSRHRPWIRRQCCLRPACSRWSRPTTTRTASA